MTDTMITHTVSQICRKENLKLNKDKCHFRCTSVPFFGENISRQGMIPDLRKLKALRDMPPLKSRKELESIPWYIQLFKQIFHSDI